MSVINEEEEGVQEQDEEEDEDDEEEHEGEQEAEDKDDGSTCAIGVADLNVTMKLAPGRTRSPRGFEGRNQTN